MPVCYPDRAGQPYRPSNGTEGMLFEEQFCGRCARNDHCEIFGLAAAYAVDEPDYPPEWIYDNDGRPVCTAFDDGRRPRRERAYRCPDTIDMFEELLDK